MAITANTIWDFQSGGSDNNGGGFDSTIAGAGTDYSQLTTQQATLTTLSVVGVTTTNIVVSLTDYTISAQDVGNIIFITGGTATSGFYQITAVNTGTNTWTMDRSVGTAAQTCPGNMGGCRHLISANSFPSVPISGNIVYIKNGTYSSLGSFTSNTGATTSPIQWLGYNSSHGDNPTSTNRPTLTWGANNMVVAGSNIVRNFIMTSTATSCMNCGTNDFVVENCKVTTTNATSTSSAILASAAGVVLNCELVAASCNGLKITTGGNVTAFGNYIHGCTAGINIQISANHVFFNIISGCTTAIVMTTSGLSSCNIMSNTLFGAETPAGTGINASSATAPIRSRFMNNIIYGFTTGVNWQANMMTNWWDYNDFFNNTTDRTNVTAGAHDVSINPGFTNTAGGDFSITGAI